jgi:hypothetical protein
MCRSLKQNSNNECYYFYISSQGDADLVTIDLVKPGSRQTQKEIAVPAQFYGQMLNQLGQIDNECIIAHNRLFYHLGDKVLPFFYMNGAWADNERRQIVVVCRMTDRPPIDIPREHQTEPGFARQTRLLGLWPDMAMDGLYYKHLSVAFGQLLLQNIDYQTQLVSDKPVSRTYHYSYDFSSVSPLSVSVWDRLPREPSHVILHRLGSSGG